MLLSLVILLSIEQGLTQNGKYVCLIVCTVSVYKTLRRYTASLTSDDPEVAHRKSIRNSRSIKNIIMPDPAENLSLDNLTIRRRAKLPSLSWVHRQMLDDTRDGNSKTHKQNCPERSSEKAISDNEDSCPNPDSMHEAGRDHEHSHIVMDRYSAMDALLAAHEDGNLEASVILANLVTAPCFVEDLACFTCHEEFSMALFRHHCRHCGEEGRCEVCVCVCGQ